MDDNNVSNVIPDLEEFQVDFDEVVNVGGGTSDFNELTNRPKYDGQNMTGNTNIPKVPEKTSDLNNDSDYQTGTEVQEAIDDRISQIDIPTKTSDLTNDGADGTSTYVEADDLATVATTGSYSDLSNKPNIPTVNDATLTINQNGVTKGTFTANDSNNETVDLTDTTYSNFTGTDGTAAGASGLVPAPATTDAGKFLKADGTWDTAGGGGGDTVYSTKTTSDGSTGGAVYIGNLDATQTEQVDPTVTDAHKKYFWALPSNNSRIPPDYSINIFGNVDGTSNGVSNNNTIMLGSGATTYAHSGIAIGNGTKADGQSVAIGSYAGGGDWSGKVGMVAIGNYAVANNSNYVIHIGGNSGNSYGVRGGSSDNSIAIGKNSMISNLTNSVALGAYAQATRQGEVNVGLVTGETTGGYNNTNYRVLGGVHDPVNAHDAATKNYVDSIVINYATLTAAGAPTTSTAATSVGQLYYDSTNDDYYYCSAIDTTDPNNPVYTWSALSTGGGGPTVVQTTGTSTTNVMSQDATTKLVYPDIANYPYKQVIGEGSIAGTNRGVVINGVLASGINGGSIAIGAPDGNFAQIGPQGRANHSIAIGNMASAGRGMQSIAIGYNSYTNSGQDNGDNIAIGTNTYAGNRSETSTVALGAYAKTTRTGEVNIGTGGQNQGYNSTDYRVLGGVHDGQLAQDAATVAQVNATIDAINTALSTNIPHIGAAS